MRHHTRVLKLINPVVTPDAGNDDTNSLVSPESRDPHH